MGDVVMQWFQDYKKGVAFGIKHHPKVGTSYRSFIIRRPVLMY
jgi:hypothetical protein